MKEMMIDYRSEENEDEEFVRKQVDNFEFCVRDGFVYFKSEGVIFQVPLQKVSQVYLN